MDIIKSSDQISLMFKEGKRKTSSYSTILVKQRDSEHDRQGRVAFVAGKKLGNAVWRNSAKRRLRAICRECGGPWNGYDVVFIAKASINAVPYSRVLDACTSMLKAGGIKR